MDAAELQSREYRDLLDIIDRLRSKGFGKYVDLPEIVVCGDQSAGKSSVLEAISGISFPTKDNLCTRFATELILRRQNTPAIRVSIIPGPQRSAEERDALGLFHVDVDTAKPDIAAVTEKAKAAMGLSDAKLFSTDILRMEICGPSQPHLTMVDLPGLFRARSGEQTLADAATVSAMVHSHAKRPRSIILAVVSAKSDFALQEITEVARKLDPNGLRTMGLITKPDTLDAGSDSEAAYVQLAQNRDVEFRLGWHVLKNRDYEMRNATSSERDASEYDFFKRGIWATMDPGHVGVASLRPRLSNVLRDQILQQLPGFLQDVASEISDCKAQLQRLGTPRVTTEDQRRYLFQVSREYTMLMQAAVNGEYSHAFFGSVKTDQGAKRRLRARLQNTLDDFAEDMRLNGSSRILLDELPEKEESSRFILRSDYSKEVKGLMKKSRGRELSGTFNPMIISELFTEQCRPWPGLVNKVKEKFFDAIDEVTSAIVTYVAAEDTVPGILAIIRKAGADLRHALESSIEALLNPHVSGHPITYNHYMTDNVQKAQQDRRDRELVKAFREFVGPGNFTKNVEVTMSPYDLYSKLKKRAQVDMQLYAGELATDYMEAYYKVACKKLIDDVAVLATEGCLVGKLPSLFQAEVILDLGNDELDRIAQEGKPAAKKRQQCREKLLVLEAGKDDLTRLDSHRSISLDTLQPMSDIVSGSSSRCLVSASDEDSGPYSRDEPPPPPLAPITAPGFDWSQAFDNAVPDDANAVPNDDDWAFARLPKKDKKKRLKKALE